MAIPAAPKASRMASARAKSLALRASARSSQLFGNQTVKRSMLSGIGTGSGGAAGRTLAYPRFRQRIQTKRIEHRTHIHQNSANFILRNIRINTIGKLRKQRVARTNRRENRSGGAGNINIVIHCGDEISRQLIGGNRNDLLTGRLPANGGTGTFDEIRHTIVRGLSLGQRLIRPFQHGTILHGTKRVTYHPSGIFRQNRRARTSRCPATSTSSHPWR